MFNSLLARWNTAFNPMGKERSITSSRELLLYSSLLCFLALSGGVHLTSAAGNLSFEQETEIEFISVRFGQVAVINCKTNDASANVTLKVQHPDMKAQEQGRITRNGQVFRIHNVVLDDGGDYICHAAVKGQKPITRTVMLHVDIKRVSMAIIPFIAKEILTGSNTSYLCEGTHGSLAWYKEEEVSADGREILKIPVSNIPGVRVKSGRDRVIRIELIFADARRSQQGIYTCELYFQAENLTLDRSVELRVLDPEAPSIEHSSFSPNIYVDSGSSVRLECNVSGFPRPSIIWRKDGSLLRVCAHPMLCGKKEKYFRLSKGLQIKKTRYPDDDGHFSCEAKNKFGIASRNFTVVVLTPPLLKKTGVQRNFFFSSGKTKQLLIPCILKWGSPNPTFSWFLQICWRTAHNKEECLHWVPSEKYSEFTGVRPSADTPTDESILTVDLMYAYIDRLKIKCLATNVEGSDSIEFNLLQVGK